MANDIIEQRQIIWHWSSMTHIKIKKMAIHNFLSFSDEEWDFEDTSNLVLIKGVNKDTESSLGDTSNGSGKSSFSHALMYALFGQLTGKFHNANLKNNNLNSVTDSGYKMMVSVELDLIDSGGNVSSWRIVRGLQKGQSSIVFKLMKMDKDDGEWHDISKSSSANTQKFLEDNILNMGFEMYQRIVMLSVDVKYNFFKLNAGQKRDFVENLFDTSVYSNMYKMMGEDMKSRGIILQNLKVNQTKCLKTKEVCEDEIVKYKASVKDRIAETESEKKELDGKLKEFGPKFEDLGLKMSALNDALATIREGKKKISSIMEVCNGEITNSRIEINNYNTTISHHERELEKHKEVLGMICADCQKIVNKFYSLDVYRDEISRLMDKISSAEAKIGEWTGKMEKVKECEQKTKEDELAKMEELGDIQVQERNLQFQKTQLMKSKRELEKRISNLKDSMENTEKIPSYPIYEKVMKELDDIEHDIKDESMKLCLMKIGSDMVSPDSIRKNIISKVVMSINAMINAYLSELGVDFTCTLTDDMNDYSILSSGDASGTDRKEIDLDLCSAGERMKLLISSQLAFRKFLMSRFNVSMNVMIIDEVVDQALDSVSIQKLLGILLQLSQKENMNIYIISHRGEVEEMFKDIPETQTMIIQKDNGISRILREE